MSFSARFCCLCVHFLAVLSCGVHIIFVVVVSICAPPFFCYLDLLPSFLFFFLNPLLVFCLVFLACMHLHASPSTISSRLSAAGAAMALLRHYLPHTHARTQPKEATPTAMTPPHPQGPPPSHAWPRDTKPPLSRGKASET